ncbi:transporter substrate-binding domain-containing protein [Janthinobacterium aquaticum]|nr:transporter substrate-binding domain-containing protein [Janthinobacterium sp. FT58W]
MSARLLSVLLLWAASLPLQAGEQPGPGRPGATLKLVSFPYPPLMLVDAGHAPAGPMVELVARVFERMGQPVQLEIVPLARALLQMETGSADAMFTVKKTPERMAAYLFSSEPILQQDYVFFTLRDTPLPFRGDLAALAGTSIGVVGGTSYGPRFDAAVKQGQLRRLEVSSSHESSFRKLLAGRMQALICSRVVGLAILQQLQAEARVKVSGPVVDTTQSYLMFNRRTVSPQLAAHFDRALQAIRQEELAVSRK